jgi:hypothetical protein
LYRVNKPYIKSEEMQIIHLERSAHRTVSVYIGLGKSIIMGPT